MAAFASKGTPLQIRVLEGGISSEVIQQGQGPGVIQLVGRALPYQGVVFETEQRIKTSWYPGNPVATQQAIGPMELPTTFSGRWSDRYLGDGTAMALYETMRAICASALSVEVSWGGGPSGDTASPVLAGAGIVRVGLIRKVRATFDREQDMGWQIDCEWRSGGEPAAPVVAATARLSPREDLTGALAQLDRAAASWEAYRDNPQVRRTGLPQSVLAAMEDAVDNIFTASDGITSAAGAIAEASVVPLRQAREVVGACEAAVAATRDATNQLLSIRPLTQEVLDSAVDLLRTRSFMFDLLAEMLAAADACKLAAEGVMEHSEPDILVEVRAPAGTDLRDLATRYYGNPDMWQAIAQFNGIQGSAVPASPTGPSDRPNRPIRVPRAEVALRLDQAC